MHSAREGEKWRSSELYGLYAKSISLKFLLVFSCGALENLFQSQVIQLRREAPDIALDS